MYWNYFLKRNKKFRKLFFKYKIRKKEIKEKHFFKMKVEALITSKESIQNFKLSNSDRLNKSKNTRLINKKAKRKTSDTKDISNLRSPSLKAAQCA